MINLYVPTIITIINIIIVIRVYVCTLFNMREYIMFAYLVTARNTLTSCVSWIIIIFFFFKNIIWKVLKCNT